MDSLIQHMYEKFKESLDRCAKKKLSKTGNVLNQLLFLKEKDLREIYSNCGISKTILTQRFSEGDYIQAKDKGLIRSREIRHRDEYFITVYGIYYFENELNEGSLKSYFDEFEEIKVKEEKLVLNPQEKLFVVFLLVCGYIDENNFQDTNGASNETLNKYFEFLKIIDNKLIENDIGFQNGRNGKNIKWGTGKNINFRKFITRIDDLSKTGLYNSARNKNNLLLSNRKDVQYLMKLLLDDHLNKGELEFVKAKMKLKEVLYELEIEVTDKLAILPPPMSDYLKDELNI